MISIYFSGNLSAANSGSAKYFRLLAERTGGELLSLGMPIETTTGFFLWQVDGNILKPDWIDKFLFYHLRSSFPKLYQYLLRFGPKVIAERKYGPNHSFNGDIKESELLVVGFMPFNVIRHIRGSFPVQIPIVSIPFFHVNDPIHQKLKGNLRSASKNITLSGAELNSDHGYNQYQLGAYLDENWFRRPKVSEKFTRPPRVIWIGRRELSKGVELFELLAKACAGEKVDFIAAGPGTEDIRGPITGLGRLSETELIDLYDTSTVMVHTGEHESYSYTTVQSWAREIPVVCLASNIATAHLVRESEGGWVVNDADSLIQKIIELIQHPVKTSTFGSNGRRWALEHATEQAYDSRVAAFLSQIKNSNHDRPS